VSSAGSEGWKRPATAGERSMLPLRGSNGRRGFTFKLDRTRRSWLVIGCYFVAVLVAALVDNLLHFIGRGFGEGERPDCQIIPFRAHGNLRAVCVHHEAF